MTAAGARLYRNPTASGMAFFDDPAQPGAIHYEEASPQEFVVTVDTWPAQGGEPRSGAAIDAAAWPRVVISRLAWPGWQARASGQVLASETADIGLLALRVPPGQPVQIEWSYFPPGLREGAWITGLTAGVLLAFAVLGWARSDAGPVLQESPCGLTS
jgi:hypothetical protein